MCEKSEKTYTLDVPEDLASEASRTFFRLPKPGDRVEFYDLGWLDGFSAVLWALVGDKLSDETVAEYEAHIANVRDQMGVKKYAKEDVRWKS